MSEPLKAPFPYFGGKRRAADLVWRALGNPPNYVEPFFGSGAVLLARPHEPKIETVNDLYCAVPNFYRAVQSDPDTVAALCDHPILEVDLHARHRWLVDELPRLREKMIADPEYFDAKFAAWWVWGLSMWIGSGWVVEGKTPEQKRPVADHKKRGRGDLPAGKSPIIDNVGVGVHKLSQKLPDLYTRGYGRGIRSAAPERGEGGRMPNLGSERGVHGADAPPCLEWFRTLQKRLRRVRVCCGDWSRVVTDSVIGTTKSRNSGMNPCGIFLDPPYRGDRGDRSENLYAVDDMDVASTVADWARDKGDDPDVRIVLAGYEGDYDMGPRWRVIPWKALRGYGGSDNENRHQERLWLSPHCLPLEDAQR